MGILIPRPGIEHVLPAVEAGVLTTGPPVQVCAQSLSCVQPGLPVNGISQAITLEWIVIFPPGDLPDRGIEPRSPASVGKFFTTEPLGEPLRLTGKSSVQGF